MHISPAAFDFVCENLDVDVQALDDIIRRIAKYGVIGDPDLVK